MHQFLQTQLHANLLSMKYVTMTQSCGNNLFDNSSSQLYKNVVHWKTTSQSWLYLMCVYVCVYKYIYIRPSKWMPSSCFLKWWQTSWTALFWRAKKACILQCVITFCRFSVVHCQFHGHSRCRPSGETSLNGFFCWFLSWRKQLNFTCCKQYRHNDV